MSCVAVKYSRVMPYALEEVLRTRARRAGCVLLLAAVLVTAMGCSAARPGDAAGTTGATGSASSPAGAGPPAVARGLVPVTVARALPYLADSAAASQEIDFGNVVGALAVDGRPTSKTSLRWVIGEADNNLDRSGVTPADDGFDVPDITSGFTVGTMSGQVTFLYGRFDTATIIGKFQAAGFQRQRAHGVTGAVLLGPVTRPSTLSAAFPVIDVSPTRLIYGFNLSHLTTAIASGSDTIARNPAVRGIAGCLGAAKAATILPQGPWGMHDPVGTGVAATSTHDLTNVLCVSLPNPAAARSLAKTLASKIKNRRNANPYFWPTLYSNPKSSFLGGPANIVRLTGQPVSTAGSALLFEVPPAEEGIAQLITPWPPPAQNRP